MFTIQKPSISSTFVDGPIWKGWQPRISTEDEEAAKHFSKIIATFKAFKSDLKKNSVLDYPNFPKNNISLRNEPQLHQELLRFNSRYLLAYIKCNVTAVQNKIKLEISKKNSVVSIHTSHDLRLKSSPLNFIYYIDTGEIVLILRQIGKGAYKSVYMGLNISKKHILALGEQTLYDNEDRENSKREVQLLQKLIGKPHILQIYRSDNLCTRTLAQQNILCTEYCDLGPLTNYMDALGWAVKVRIACEILKGLREVHRVKCVHRDVKPDNIFLKMVGSQIQAVVADFGFACPIDSVMIKKYCGTPLYLPIEVLKKITTHNYLSDAWSVGVVFSELFYGEHPLNMDTDELSDSEFFSRLETLERATAAETLSPSVEIKTLPYLSFTPLDQIIRKLLQPETLRIPVGEALELLENAYLTPPSK